MGGGDNLRILSVSRANYSLSRRPPKIYGWCPSSFPGWLSGIGRGQALSRSSCPLKYAIAQIKFTGAIYVVSDVRRLAINLENLITVINSALLVLKECDSCEVCHNQPTF